MVRDTESMKKKSSQTSIKFLCSYGGKILPRSSDGKLRYVGGLTRVLSVDRSISITELMVKLVEFCGYSVTLKCQLPNGDLDTLVSIKSDEDLRNIIEVYDDAASRSPTSAPSKIRAVLSPPISLKQISPPPSSASSVNLSTPTSADSNSPVKDRFRRRSFSPPPPTAYPVKVKACYYPCHLQQHNPRVFFNAPCWH